jgi:hypothetical protein
MLAIAQVGLKTTLFIAAGLSSAFESMAIDCAHVDANYVRSLSPEQRSFQYIEMKHMKVFNYEMRNVVIP